MGYTLRLLILRRTYQPVRCEACDTKRMMSFYLWRTYPNWFDTMPATQRVLSTFACGTKCIIHLCLRHTYPTQFDMVHVAHNVLVVTYSLFSGLITKDSAPPIIPEPILLPPSPNPVNTAFPSPDVTPFSIPFATCSTPPKTLG